MKIYQKVLKIPILTILFLFGFNTGVSYSADMIAEAEISGCADNEISGTGVLIERESEEGIKSVDVSLIIKGLKDGKHAVHIHESGSCKPCSAAKGHHDPGPNSNTKPDAPDFNHPFHMGDLVNMEVKDGVGVMQTTTNRVTLSEGRLSIFDSDGAAFIIHTYEDKYCDDESEMSKGCAGGSRDACGIIKMR
ncbi:MULTISPECIES: superoxide dismutase family protein [unclassified Nitrospina]|uniref:superoxide dismutase family protein n=1 Tax=unclassified Nitrospina TaxID=2638683 RepID=UPI003F9C51C5